MTTKEDLKNLIEKTNPVSRFFLWTGVAVLIWIFSSKGIQDAVVYGAFIFALIKAKRGAAAWKQPAGIAFIVALAYLTLTIPFSTSPYYSMRDFIKFFEVIAGAFAIPVIFNTRAKIKSALFYSATAIAITMAYDLARLHYHLGAEILHGAHAFEPFILNHSNVSSMMAGASCFIFFYFFYTSLKTKRTTAAACLAGMLICFAYLVALASRGPQLAFTLTCCCFGFIIPGLRGKFIWCLCVIAAGAILIANMRTINPRFFEKSTISNFSDRDKVWKHSWDLSLNRPWFGHGYGKRNFVAIYKASDPPEARFEFPHPHQFWLKILFESGWIGFALNFAAWSILATQLLRSVLNEQKFKNRLLPGVVGLTLLYIHLYGLGDYPDHILLMAQFWLIPTALVLIKDENQNLHCDAH